jgi:hypothetical protein
MMDSLFGRGGELFYQMAINEMHTFSNTSKIWKEKIIKKYRESSNLPRKKKKQVRKELMVEWSIASWDPFKF